MTQLRLNNLMTLNVHKEALDGMNLEEVGDEFISHSEHWCRIFGSFAM